MNHDDPNEARAHVWKLMEKIRTCMLTTNEGDMLHGRPMSAYPNEEEGAVYFLTDSRTIKEEILHDNPQVALCFVEGTKYLCVSGEATVENDRAKIRALWNIFVQAWWDNPEDPAIRVVRVTPARAQYWETPAKPVVAVDMAIAAVTGARPNVGKERKVDMR